MSNEITNTTTSDNDSQEIHSTNLESKGPPTQEMTWLVSGLLILVIGIGGVLMFSQGEDLLVENTQPVHSDQFTEGFPSPAMASQSEPSHLPSEASILPVSLVQGDAPINDNQTQKDIEEKVVYFDFDNATLSDEAKTHLAPQGELDMDETQTILVRGHTDQKGSEAYNKNLSTRRANAVKAYLVSLGHHPDSIHVEGLGKEQPLCNELTDACAKQNRRVNLYFSTPDTSGGTSDSLVSQVISGSEQDSLAPPKAPTEVTEPDQGTAIETVQLAESAEEIIPPDPIASSTTSQ